MRTTEFTVPCTCCTQRAPRIARSCLKRRLSNSTRISIVEQRNSLTSKIEMEVGLAVHAMMSHGITCTSFRLTQLNASTRCSPDGDIDSQTSTKTGQAKYTDRSLPTKNTSMRITPLTNIAKVAKPKTRRKRQSTRPPPHQRRSKRSQQRRSRTRQNDSRLATTQRLPSAHHHPSGK